MLGGMPLGLGPFAVFSPPAHTDRPLQPPGMRLYLHYEDARHAATIKVDTAGSPALVAGSQPA